MPPPEGRAPPPAPREEACTCPHSTRAGGQGCCRGGRGTAPARSDLLDVDGLGSFLPILLFVRHLRSLGQRAVAVADDAREVNEQVPAALVGRDEAEALVVREPLDRP